MMDAGQSRQMAGSSEEMSSHCVGRDGPRGRERAEEGAEAARQRQRLAKESKHKYRERWGDVKLRKEKEPGAHLHGCRAVCNRLPNVHGLRR